MAYSRWPVAKSPKRTWLMARTQGTHSFLRLAICEQRSARALQFLAISYKLLRDAPSRAFSTRLCSCYWRQSSNGNIPTTLNLYNELVTLKQRHSNQRKSVGLIYRNAPQAPIPFHGCFVDIENTFTPIRQNSTTSAVPRQTKLRNNCRRKTQPTIKTCVDDSFNFAILTRRPQYLDAD